ncbi:MAG: hypothetical protein WBM21_02420 [Christensenellales bacterium]
MSLTDISTSEVIEEHHDMDINNLVKNNQEYVYCYGPYCLTINYEIRFNNSDYKYYRYAIPIYAEIFSQSDNKNRQ